MKHFNDKKAANEFVKSANVNENGKSKKKAELVACYEKLTGMRKKVKKPFLVATEAEWKALEVVALRKNANRAAMAEAAEAKRIAKAAAKAAKAKAPKAEKKPAANKKAPAKGKAPKASKKARKSAKKAPATKAAKKPAANKTIKSTKVEDLPKTEKEFLNKVEDILAGK